MAVINYVCALSNALYCVSSLLINRAVSAEIEKIKRFNCILFIVIQSYHNYVLWFKSDFGFIFIFLCQIMRQTEIKIKPRTKLDHYDWLTAYCPLCTYIPYGRIRLRLLMRSISICKLNKVPENEQGLWNTSQALAMVQLYWDLFVKMLWIKSYSGVTQDNIH